MEFLKIKTDEGRLEFLEKLEHLDEFFKEELREIAKKVKAKKYQSGCQKLGKRRGF